MTPPLKDNPTSALHLPTFRLMRSMQLRLAQLSDLSKWLTSLAWRGKTFALVGELGAGKTTFVHSFCAGLGDGGSVNSPTYVLQQIYQVAGSTIEHWDLYRLGVLPEELNEPPNSDCVRFVEWADKFPELTCDYCLEFVVNWEDLSERTVKIYQVVI